MESSLWPVEGAEKVLIIVDASNAVEQDLLLSWANEFMLSVGYQGVTEHVVLPIADDPESVSSEPLLTLMNSDPNTLILPIRVAWMSAIDEERSRPRLLDLLRGNNPRRPKKRQMQSIIKRNPDRARCISGEPATLENLRERLTQRKGEAPGDEALAEFITSQAALVLDVAERRLKGGRYKVPRRVAKDLLSSSQFNAELKQTAEAQNQSLDTVLDEANEIMDELISRPQPFWQDVFGAMNRKFVSLGYETEFVIDRDKLDRLKQIVRTNPSALLWTHKTHVDGMAIGSLLYENDFPTAHTIGGVNMAFAGVGYVGRRSGAVFIRRSFQDNPLYKMILRNYLSYLLSKRFPLTWAFEGTRSRVGKLMPPRYGILKYVMEAAHANDVRNLHIIPVAINYDLIGDVKDYAAEQVGGTKTPESLAWFVRYLRGLSQPLGRIYIDFGEPVVLEKPLSVDDPLNVAKVAFQVGVEANKVTPITLASLMTMILLGASPRALTRDELIKEIQTITDWARVHGISLSSDFESENAAHMTQLLHTLVSNGLISRYEGGPEIVYSIAADKQAIAGYYRNTIIHHFVTKAITEMALMIVPLDIHESPQQALDAFWAEADSLRDMFKFEFFYAPSDEFRKDVAAELERIDPDWESKLLQDTDHAITLILQGLPVVAHSTLRPFVEAYRVVADVIAATPEHDIIEQKTCVTKALAYGKQALMQQRISSQASIGKLMFENGYKLFSQRGLTEAGASIGEQRRQQSQAMRSLVHRLEKLKTLVLPTDM